MRWSGLVRLLAGAVIFACCSGAAAHPLRLSLSEIEYSSSLQRLTVSLRLFLMDVNEALVFDPDSDELAFGEANEAPYAEGLLIDYLNEFFFIKANGQRLPLTIEKKFLNGEGDNVALVVLFEYDGIAGLSSLELRNAVFTDLFFDQSNVIYVHVDDDSTSLMLNKKTQSHLLTF